VIDRPDVHPTPLMICDACRQPCPWNPFGTCSWACFDTRGRNAAPEAFAYFMGIGPGDRVDDESCAKCTHPRSAHDSNACHPIPGRHECNCRYYTPR
jgi:hypothetical protein